MTDRTIISSGEVGGDYFKRYECKIKELKKLDQKIMEDKIETIINIKKI